MAAQSALAYVFPRSPGLCEATFTILTTSTTYSFSTQGTRNDVADVSEPFLEQRKNFNLPLFLLRAIARKPRLAALLAADQLSRRAFATTAC